MSNNKYNIEEVFKSELEDFEMDMPQNAWSNISNNINSPVSSGLLSGSITQLVALVAAAGIIGAVITFSLTKEKEETKTVQKIELETKTEAEVNKSTVVLEEVLETVSENTEANQSVELLTEEETKPEVTTYIVETEAKDIVAEEDTEENIDTEENFANESVDSPTVEESKTNDTNPEVNRSNEEINVIEKNAVEIIADILATPIGGYSPLLVEFSHATENVKSNWNFGDGVEARAQKVSHTFNQPGTYTVELLLTNENGTTSTAQTIIHVLSTSKIETVPNIFTPNNDGSNDFFVIKSKNIKEFKLHVFERNGTELFETSDIEKGWNGENKYGEQVAEGNYFYLIKAVGTDGKQYKEKGVIRLDR